MIGKIIEYTFACLAIAFVIGVVAILSAKLLIVLAAIILIGAACLIIASPFIFLYYLFTIRERESPRL